MGKQEKIFLKSEADQWFNRNINSIKNIKDDSITSAIKEMNLNPTTILEVGCSNGYRLAKLQKDYHAACYGIEPSKKAIIQGQKSFPESIFKQGVATQLPYENAKFDMVIFGFCLYLCSGDNLFQIAAEADRVLADKGYLIIFDFHTSYPYKNKYSHCENIDSYKFDHSKMFAWNPNYEIIYLKKESHDQTILDLENEDNIISVTILSKTLNGWRDRIKY